MGYAEPARSVDSGFAARKESSRKVRGRARVDFAPVIIRGEVDGVCWFLVVVVVETQQMGS